MLDSPEVAPAPARPFIRPEHHSTLIGAAIYLIFYTGMVLFNTFPPKLPPVLWALLAPLTTVLYIFFLTYALRMFCRLAIRPAQETLFMLCAMLLFLVLNPMVREIAWKLMSGHSWAQVYSQIARADADDKSVVGILLQILVPFLLILTGAFFGQIIARLIRERALLVPVGIIAGLVDFWGVFWGPVGNWSANAPVVVSQMASAASAAVAVPNNVTLPHQLQVFGHIAPPSTIGIGDFVFLAMFLTCAYRLNFSPKRTMWGIFSGLLLCSVILALNGQWLFGIKLNFDYLPGLVFIAGGVLLANIGSWQLSRQEWAMTLALAAIFLVFIGYTGYTSHAAELAKRRLEEQGMPHPYQTFTITTPSSRESIQQVFAQLTAGPHPAAGLIPVGIKVLYSHQPHAAVRAEHWTSFAVEHRAGATIRQQRDFIADAGWDSKTSAWKVQVYTECPPTSTLQLLAQLNPKQRDMLALLNNAKSIPAGAYPLLDLKHGLPPLDRLPSRFLIRLLPTSGEYATQKAVVKLSYPGAGAKVSE